MVTQCGLILDPEFPFMCLTRWSSLLCHVLEIKCPFSCKNEAFSEAILDNPSFSSEHDSNTLRRLHA